MKGYGQERKNSGWNLLQGSKGISPVSIINTLYCGLVRNKHCNTYIEYTLCVQNSMRAFFFSLQDLSFYSKA